MGGIRLILGTGLLLMSCGISLAQDKTSPAKETYPYQAANQFKVEGVVQEVREYQCPVTGTVGTHLILKYSGGIIEAHLAPATFLKKYEIVINKGDQVEIQGARILYEGKPALLARTVAVDRVTFAFRDSSGKPLW